MGTCWFCEKGVATDESAFVLQLERTVQSQPEDGALVIARCPQCKKEHGSSGPEVYGLFGGGGCGCLLALMLGISIVEAIHIAGPGKSLLIAGTLALTGAILGGMGGFRAVAFLKPGGRRGTIKPESAYLKHPELEVLRAAGWEPVVMSGTRRLALWQKQCAHPDTMYAEARPDECPVCGSNTKTSAVSVVGALTVGPDIALSVRCERCGAWACTNCAHNHFGKRPANTYRGEDSGAGVGARSFIAWPDLKWTHDHCCPCTDQWVEHSQQARARWMPRRQS